VSECDRVEGSSALNDSGSAGSENSGDRLESAVSKVERARNDQVDAVQSGLPGVTPELFLAAGEELAGRASVQGVRGDPVDAVRALAAEQGAAARCDGCAR